VTDQRKDTSEEFIVSIIVKSNGLDRITVLTNLNHVLENAGLCKYFRNDDRIGFTLSFCKLCGEPIDDFGECVGCGKNNLQIENKVPAVPVKKRHDRGEKNERRKNDKRTGENMIFNILIKNKKETRKNESRKDDYPSHHIGE
jgi:hypothetical protein